MQQVACVQPKIGPSGAAGATGDLGAAPARKSRNWAVQTKENP